MFYADTVGLPNVRDGLRALGLQPAQLLTDCIDANLSLAKFVSSRNFAHFLFVFCCASSYGFGMSCSCTITSHKKQAFDEQLSTLLM